MAFSRGYVSSPLLFCWAGSEFAQSSCEERATPDNRSSPSLEASLRGPVTVRQRPLQRMTFPVSTPPSVAFPNTPERAAC